MEVFLRTTFSFILRTRRAIGVQGPCPFVFLDFHWILLGFSLWKGPFSGSRFLIGLFPVEGPDVVDHLASASLLLVFVTLFCLLLVFNEWGE
jgi:hypothetical protein